jgi:signal transduction histidine kinase
MFKSARIKLTIWYLAIIMGISILFSVVLYSVISKELHRGFRRAELRYIIGQNVELPRPIPKPFDVSNPDLLEDLQNAKNVLIFNLITLNFLIFGFSSFAGYFLAGKTLAPIEKALEEQKRFVADASHEMRTPLTSLKTSMEVALREKKLSNNSAKTEIKSNLEEVNGLINLTNSLLSLASIKGNNNHILENVEIKEIIETSIKKIRPLARKKRISIKTNLTKHAIQANKQKLIETFTIFLDNSVKYTPLNGSINIKILKENSNLSIKISDTGIGISKNDLPHIFDRFFRADHSRSKMNIPGFGLGLSLARKNILLHKGSIDVKSFPEKGTTFTVRLPVKQT